MTKSQLEDYYELYRIKENEKIFETLLKEIEQCFYPKNTIKFLQCTTNKEKLEYLKNEAIDDISFQYYIYNRLNSQKFNYNFSLDIQAFMLYLNRLNKTFYSKKSLEPVKNDILINDINYRLPKKQFTLDTKIGTYSFKNAAQYFKRNSNVLDLINKLGLKAFCHNQTYYLSTMLKNENAIAITSLINSYFTNKFLHSYTYFPKENIIVDLTTNTIMDKEQYYKLFSPEEIIKISGKHLENLEKIYKPIDKNNGLLYYLAIDSLYQKENPIKRIHK